MATPRTTDKTSKTAGKYFYPVLSSMTFWSLSEQEEKIKECYGNPMTSTLR